MLKFRLDEDLPPGVTVKVGDNGECEVTIDPVLAHNLQGSKRQLAALRQTVSESTASRRLVEENERMGAERRALTDVLMKVTMALSGMLEGYDWLLQSPTSGLTDDGRARMQAFFLASVPAARQALANAGAVDVSWEEVVSGRKLDRGEAPVLANVWATMAREVAPAVNGPEGAALLRTLDAIADAHDEDSAFADGADWLHLVYERSVEGAAACRGLMDADPERKEFASQLYRGFIAVSLNAGRQLALRQLALVPEPPPVKSDPYVVCHDCIAKSTCEAQRRCARVGPKE